jgi:hypothetical protein
MLLLPKCRTCVSAEQATKVPLEPRYVAEYAAFDDAPSKNPVDGPLQRQLGYHELNVRHSRRGPRIGPSFEEELLALPTQEREAFLLQQQDDIDRVVGNLERAGTEEWDVYTGRTARSSDARDAQQGRLDQPAQKKSWSDKIIISQDTQVRRDQRHTGYAACDCIRWVGMVR